jgi:hypothetical protein
MHANGKQDKSRKRTKVKERKEEEWDREERGMGVRRGDGGWKSILLH